ncbi:MAG: hypothetical protein KGZ38_03835 [Erysipelothrix sp.]|nr:hypothetical protein [Erysipelothrix sp.]
MTSTLRLSHSHFKVTTLISRLLLSVMFVFFFTSNAHAVLKVPDEASLVKIEENLIEKVHPTITISSAWIIDFPSEVKLSFYQVIAFVGEDKVEKTFFLDMNTYDLVDEALIESYREQEANAVDPIMTTTGTKDLEVGKTTNNLWALPLLAGLIALGSFIFKDKKAQVNH